MSLTFIFLSLVITTLLVSYLTLKTLNLKSFFKGLGIDPEKKITDQPIFWLFISYPTVIALNLAIPLWIKYDLEFNAEAYTRFIDISALPLGFVLCAMYLVHVLIRIHSSSQTAQQLQNQSLQIYNQKSQIGLQEEQLKNQRDQVQLKNYIDFKTYTIDAIEKLEKDGPYKIIDKNKFFSALFPKFSPVSCNLETLQNTPQHIIGIKKGIYKETLDYLNEMDKLRSEFGHEQWDSNGKGHTVIIEATKISLLNKYLSSLQSLLFKSGIKIETKSEITDFSKQRNNIAIILIKDQNNCVIKKQHEFIIQFLDYLYYTYSKSADADSKDVFNEYTNKIKNLSDRFDDCSQILNDYISNKDGELIFANNTKQPSQPE